MTRYREKLQQRGMLGDRAKVVAWVSDRHAPTADQRQYLESRGYDVVHVTPPLHRTIRRQRFRSHTQVQDCIAKTCVTRPDLIIAVLPIPMLIALVNAVHPTPVLRAVMNHEVNPPEWTGNFVRIVGGEVRTVPFEVSA